MVETQRNTLMTRIGDGERFITYSSTESNEEYRNENIGWIGGVLIRGAKFHRNGFVEQWEWERCVFVERRYITTDNTHPPLQRKAKFKMLLRH